LFIRQFCCGTYISTHIVLIKSVTFLISNANVTLIERTDDCISLNFMSFLTIQHNSQYLYISKQAHYGNNGDYVQSWASLQYYPCVDRSFERDNLKNLPHLRFYGRSNWNEIDNENK